MSLKADNISVRFGGLRAIDDVSLDFAKGEIFGLIGPNGAGKTTLVNVLSGFQRPQGGSIGIDGRDCGSLKPYAFARRGVVRTFQAVRLFPQLTVSENVEVGCISAGLGRRAARARARSVLDYLGIGDRAERPAHTLNYGDERRVGLARALALNPSYLLLDEPAAGLNAGETELLRRQIADVRNTFGCGILVIEHNMALIMALCERIHVLTTGRTLTVGTPREVLADAQVREAYLGARPV